MLATPLAYVAHLYIWEMSGFEPRVFIPVQANYLKGGQTASAGARLEVHASDKRQLVQEFGLNLEPNKEHNIGIRAVCSTSLCH